MSRILVAAVNPALDITHELAGVDWSGVNRPAAVSTRPGGKGLNVGRTLHALGADVLVIGLLGGPAGEAISAGLASAGVPAAFTAIAAESRRTFAVVDTERRQTALFNEPGPLVSRDEYSAFLARFDVEVKSSAVVVLSGSLPPGLPRDSYAQLGVIAAVASVPVVLDADGRALLHGASARPAIVKPNLAELESAVGRRLRTGSDEAGAAAGEAGAAAGSAGGAAGAVGHAAGASGDAAIVAAAHELRSAGAEAVAVSLGADGLLAVTADGVWRATPPGGIAGNPTGAGDAVVAGLAQGLARADSWPRRLRHAAALGAAAAAAPLAGEFSRADYARALGEVKLTRIEVP